MVKLLLTAVVAVIAAGVYWSSRPAAQPPVLDEDAWWGPEDTKNVSDISIRRYRVKFLDSMVKELRERLISTRYPPPPLEDTYMEYGYGQALVEHIVRYWLYKYRFSERETFLNQFPHYKTKVQGLDLHFIRVQPKLPSDTNIEVVPMLLLHGWPGSVREFYEAIPLLTAPGVGRDFALELIVPSLPGFGFSEAAVKPGLGAAEVAVVMRNLMKRLGFSKYYIQGGDWGSLIGTNMAILYPEEVLGFHTNMAFVNTPLSNLLTVIGSVYPPLIVEEELQDRMYPMSKRFSELLLEMGYFHIQATKPDTVGASMSQSPAGLAAYILEKFSSMSAPGHVFDQDALLDNLMMYWITDSATTSFRLYAETFNKKQIALGLEGIPVPVPTWIIQAKKETYQPPLLLKLRYPNTLNFTVLQNGGHFLAMELPEVFAEDVLNAVSEFRKYWSSKKIAE